MASRHTEGSVSDGSIPETWARRSEEMADDTALADRCNSVIREIKQLELDLTKTEHRLRKARNTTRRRRIRLSRFVAEKVLRVTPQFEYGETALAQVVLAAQKRAKTDGPVATPHVGKTEWERLSAKRNERSSTATLSIRKPLD